MTDYLTSIVKSAGINSNLKSFPQGNTIKIFRLPPEISKKIEISLFEKPVQNSDNLEPHRKKEMNFLRTDIVSKSTKKSRFSKFVLTKKKSSMKCRVTNKSWCFLQQRLRGKLLKFSRNMEHYIWQ